MRRKRNIPPTREAIVEALTPMWDGIGPTPLEWLAWRDKLAAQEKTPEGEMTLPGYKSNYEATLYRAATERRLKAEAAEDAQYPDAWLHVPSAED